MRTLFLCLAALFGWYWMQDPLSSLDKGEPSFHVVEKNTYSLQDEGLSRTLHDYVLDAGSYGTLRFSVSLPEKMPSGGLPVVAIVDGLETGRKSLELIKGHGDYALIAYEYPKILHELKGYSALRYLVSLRKAALDVPGQLIALAKWASQEEWSNQMPISLMGVSFGSEFLPSTLHLARKMDISFGPTIFAYGGAGLFRLFYAFSGSAPVRFLRALLGMLIFRPLEPERHLENIQGEFLILNGIYDRQIPWPAAQKLQKLIPEPKTIINLKTSHLQPTSYDLLQTIVTIAREWLEKSNLSQ